MPTKSVLVPYSSSDSELDIDEEMCVGKRGYKAPKAVPKRLKNKKQRSTTVKPNPCIHNNCGRNCSSNFTEKDRELLNEHFWGMGSSNRQKEWLRSCIKRKSVARKRSESAKRQFTYEYNMNYNFKHIEVCQQFLLKTLNISQQMLRNVRNSKHISSAVGDIKTKAKPHNKTDESKILVLKSFIENLPAVPSHYCRNKSNKLYISSEFRNISGLYKAFTQHLISIHKESSQMSLRVFRSVFKNNFNIGFHLPKKDKCVTCESYKNLEEEDKKTIEQSEKYKNHIKDKEECKKIFLEEQTQSKTNSSFLCASFDLQKVLNTPHSKSVTLFYSRKYSYYNESVYENGTRNGYCFLWGETDGKRGCNEIATVLFQYLARVDQRGTCSSISLYCDSCAGQNRNRAVLSALKFFLETAVFIKKIKITYLLPGHTMMPVDSIHSTIESFIRDRSVWAPSEWYTVISNARTRPAGYECVLMNNGEFKDWKSFSQVLFPSSIKISFKTLRSAIFEKDSSIIILKYGYFQNSETTKIDLSTISRSKRNLPITKNGPIPAYNDFLKISSAKYNDLKKLCDKNTINKKFHNEYLSLKHANTIKDTLPETDEEDTKE